MAGKIDFQVSANPEKAVADLAKIINKQDQMIDKLRTTNRESKKAGQSVKAMGSPMQGMVANVGAIAAGWLSAQGILQGFRTTLNLARGEFDEMVRKMESFRGAQVGFDRAAIEAISGHIGAGPGLGGRVEQLKQTGRQMPTVPVSETPALYQRYAGARPMHPGGTEPLFAAALEAVGMAGGPISEASRSMRLGLVGQLQLAMPDLVADDAFDLATMFIREAGAMAPGLEAGMQGVHSIKHLGGDPENVLARLTTAVQAKQKPRAFRTLASVMSQVRNLAPVKKIPGKPLTARQQAQLETQGMSVDELMEWIDANKESGIAEKLIGSTWSSVAPLFGPGVGAAGKAAMQQAMTSDVYATETAAIRGSGVGRFITATDTAAALAEEMKFIDKDAAASGAIRKAFKEGIADLPNLGAIEKKIAGGKFAARGAWAGDWEAAALAGIGGIEEKYGPTTEYLLRGMPVSQPNVRSSPEVLQVLKELRDAIRELAAKQPVTTNVGAGMD